MNDGTTAASWRQRLQARKRHLLIGGVVTVVVVALVGDWLHWRWAHVEETDARIEGEVINIASRVDGWLMTRPVQEGDLVVKGQVLAELDTRDAQLRLKALLADIATEAAEVAQIQAERETTAQTSRAAIDTAEAELNAARAALANAHHELERADADYRRAEGLFKANTISRQEWEHTRTTFYQAQDAAQQAQAEVTSKAAALVSANAELGQLTVLDREVDVARQKQASLQAQADQVQQEIDDRTLRAPVAGVIDKTLGEAGDYIQAGQWILLMHNPDRLWVEANIKETAIGDIRPGQTVSIDVDAYPGQTLSGTVAHVGHAATNQFALLPTPNPSGNFTKITQRVPVRVTLPTTDLPLKPGLMVEVAIDVTH